jgi:hypothetical protein
MQYNGLAMHRNFNDLKTKTMNKESQGHRERLEILERHIGDYYYMIGNIHNGISDAMEEYHQTMKIELKIFNDLIDTVVKNSCNNEAVITNVELWAKSWKEEINQALLRINN